MTLSTLDFLQADPTIIFDIFRGNFGTEILTVAVIQFNLFGVLAERGGALLPNDLQQYLDLADRPSVVLFTALRAMGLLDKNAAGELVATKLAAEYLTPGAYFDVSQYLNLGSETPGVKNMAAQMLADSPSGTREESKGAEYTFDDSEESAMSDPNVARILTEALAGRARNCAPYLAQTVHLQPGQTLLDIGGGSDLCAIAFLQRYPDTSAILLDAPEVLKVAAKMAAKYGVADRLELRNGNMLKDELPAADVMLLSNILHDWDVPECQKIVAHCAKYLPTGGRLLIHDTLLNDAMDGPLPIALYSIALMTITKGRAYSGAEYRAWCEAVGLRVESEVKPTLVHCSVLTAIKS